jgi:hypothetical protein
MTFIRQPGNALITPPPLANIFTLTQTGSNGSLINTTGGLYFSAPQRVTTEDSIFATQPNPGGTGAAYTLTVGFIPTPGGKNGSAGFFSFSAVGIGLYETSTTKIKNLIVYSDVNGNFKFQAAFKTGLTTAVTTTFDVGAYALLMGNMIWMKVQDDGTTNRIWYISTDGTTYKAMLSEARGTGFTAQPDKIGLYINPSNADAQMMVMSYTFTSP